MSHSSASKVTPFDSLHMVSYYRPIVTLCLKCTVFEISGHIGRKSPKKLPHSHLTLPLQRTPHNIRINLTLVETAIPGIHFCQWRRQTIKSGSAFKGQLYFQVGQMEGPTVPSDSWESQSNEGGRFWKGRRSPSPLCVCGLCPRKNFKNQNQL